MNLIIKAIGTMAETNRHAPAVISPGRTLTYFELFRLIAIISNHFAARKLRRRSKVFLNFADPDLRLIVSIACLHYGLMPFILLEIGDLAEEVDFDLVIGSPEPQLPELASHVLIDQAAIEGAGIDPEFHDFGEIAEDDIFFVASTTGTTGRPKLVAETLAAFKGRATTLGALGAIRHDRPVGRDAPARRVLSTLGDTSKYGFGLSLRLLSVGATIVRAHREPLEILKLIELYSVTHLLTTPLMMTTLLGHMERRNMRNSTIHSLQLTGALFQQSLLSEIEARFDAEIRVIYGSAEVGGIASGVVKSSSFKRGYVGELSANVTIVSAGTETEPKSVTIVNSSDILASYYKDGKIVRNEQPFYTLPDLGYLVGTGLFLVGRDDEVFNWSGNKTAFSLIETGVRKIPGIIDVGIASGASVGDPVGLIVGLVAGAAIDLTAVKASICRIVQSPGVAPHIQLFHIEEIPRNPMGKLDRQKLIEAYHHSNR